MTNCQTLINITVLHIIKC